MTTRAGLATILGQEMWRKLNEPRNIDKGDGWRDMTFDELWMHFMIEVEELRIALSIKTDDDVQSEIADCANFLAMILDKLQCAKLT